VLVGPSRKGFIAEVAPGAEGQRPAPGERDGGTAAAVTAAVLRGAHAVRVHEVAGMRQAVLVAAALREGARP
jgi:dihydropteroate synthase